MAFYFYTVSTAPMNESLKLSCGDLLNSQEKTCNGLQWRCFPANFVKSFWTVTLQNTCEWLLLKNSEQFEIFTQSLRWRQKMIIPVNLSLVLKQFTLRFNQIYCRLWTSFYLLGKQHKCDDYWLTLIAPAGIFPFKVNDNENTRAMREICSKLTITSPQWRQCL